ncbi:uncharacterized protein (TIGR00299 family) protein [Methanolinea mesophila]|uniref:nickel pincer cofactor biosynthesis protein LarC n=1 Tax=Methanolinea mesophila TaxID=547055 RepID=UPI001AE58284|nr:nickel pincer cofactor biosynthesis protein LarC [Methanolinea mesophila]MBP1928756.1 uncharacterized protein (TIGR00299 family) protein [Methanolinea mesophila]
MRILVLDPFRGAAGDMITGSLLHLGADRDQVIAAMASVVETPEIATVNRVGITAFKVHTRAGHSHRTLDEVLDRLSSAKAPAPALEMAGRVFSRIARAEEEVHGKTAHFHEVGADDAVADIIGACTALHTLNVDGIWAYPVALGGGMIQGHHGSYPVPAPATLVILRDSSLESFLGSPEDGELATPTGVALLAEFVASLPGGPLTGRVTGVGYGAGTRDSPRTPNVFRSMILEGEGGTPGQVDILETNVDDVNGEVLASAFSRIMDAGARDVSAIPCLMKKGRPGYLIRVMVSPHKSREMARMLAAELGTLGVRCIPSVHRFVADREFRKVTVEAFGQQRAITVKLGLLEGKIFSLKAEYDELAAWADELGVPVRELALIVEDSARAAFREERST